MRTWLVAVTAVVAVIAVWLQLQSGGTGGAGGEAPVLRELLSRSVLPVHYKVLLEPSFETYRFHGSETVLIAAKESEAFVTLHAHNLEITACAVRLPGASSATQCAGVAYDAGKKQATIALPWRLPVHRQWRAGAALAELAHDSLVRLELEFEGTLSDHMMGFYRSKVGDPTFRFPKNSRQEREASFGQHDWVLSTQFEPVDARQAFPCFDEPALKATFDFGLRYRQEGAQEHYRVLSNTPAASDTVEDGLRTVTFERTPVMSTYLAAFVMGDFDYVEAATERRGTRVRVYTPVGRKEEGEFALLVATHTLAFFEGYFGIDYALPKIDLVSIPDFGPGAMENWGLVTFRETALLIDASASGVASKQRVAYVVAHELAHQWFGNLVTMEWWKELWLNEGFATYVGNLAVARQFPEWDIWTKFGSDYYSTALSLDSLVNSHPVEVDVATGDQIMEIFDTISYCKGAAIIRKVVNYIGEESFQRGMHAYLSAHAYKNAVTTDLWNALAQASGKDVPAYMQQWTQQMGYPVVFAEVQQQRPDGILLLLEQRRFLSSPLARRLDDEDFVWTLSIDVVTSDGEVHQVLVDKARVEAFIPLKTASSQPWWFKLNYGQAGFFRVAYRGEHLMGRVRAALEQGNLPAIDRMGLVDDLFALARADMIPTEQVLALLGAFETESDLTVWSKLAGELEGLAVVFKHDEALYEEALRPALAKLFGGLARRLGWEAAAEESDLTTLLRSLALQHAAAYGDEEVVEECRRRFYAHMAGEEELDANLRGAVYFAVVRNQREDCPREKEPFRILKEHSLDLEQSADERARALVALGATVKMGQVRQAIRHSLSPKVRVQDAFYLYKYLTHHPMAAKHVWEFMWSHWILYRERFEEGQFLFARVLSMALSTFASEEAAASIEAFFAKDGPNLVPATERTLDQVLEAVRNQAHWLAGHAAGIRRAHAAGLF